MEIDNYMKKKSTLQERKQNFDYDENIKKNLKYYILKNKDVFPLIQFRKFLKENKKLEIKRLHL